MSQYWSTLAETSTAGRLVLQQYAVYEVKRENSELLSGHTVRDLIYSESKSKNNIY